MVKMSASAIIFDSDGVLVDSHLDGRQAWDQLSAEFGFDLDDAIFGRLTGIRPTDSLANLVPDRNLAAAVDRLEDLEVALASATASLPGARHLLHQLPPDRWAIATSAGRRLALARWRDADIPIPDVVVAAEDVTFGKPHPEPYATAAAALGFDAAECVVFEDSPAGGQAGADAGATVVAVGAQNWPRRPVARVASLADVAVRPTEDGRITLSLDVLNL